MYCFSSSTVLVLLSVVVASLFFNQGATFETQRLFNNAVIRVQHLHQLAAKMMDDFVSLLQIDLSLVYTYSRKRVSFKL